MILQNHHQQQFTAAGEKRQDGWLKSERGVGGAGREEERGRKEDADGEEALETFLVISDQPLAPR